ncbi:MAG: ParB N-terminal domain-containing protein, partial [Anaerolineae bacterium]|nr:ParB N-terminal domain-containing protein [Anaerolineae bacterium]
MSRRDRSKLSKAFGSLPEPVTKEEIDMELYGDIAALDELRRDATPVDIFSIYPDVTQPRRIIPSEVRHAWAGDPAEIAALFEAWFAAITRERYARLEKLPEEERQARSYFDLGAYLEGTYLGGSGGEDEDEASPASPGPLEAGFRLIVDLAATIRRDGLINPITVAHAGANYRLETGERRWLAYHLLHAYFDGTEGRPDEQSQWQKIPAYTVDQASVWRMAHENNVRDDLNAIGKARQFALLLMNIYALRGVQFTPFHEVVEPGESDRSFYSQVADGGQFPMPRGNTERLLNAMGFTSKSELRENRSLLTLPDEVWQWADDLGWAQYRVRRMQQLADRDPERLIEIARREAEKDGLSVGIPTLSPS